MFISSSHTFVFYCFYLRTFVAYY